MNARRLLVFGILVLVGAMLAQASVTARAQHSQKDEVPIYKVDPNWPKQLPNNWIVGQIGGMAVDKDDHVWVLHRPRSLTVDEAAAAQNPPIANCCVPAPSVLEFDSSGNLLRSWGGPAYISDWPTVEHGIYVDKSGHVWIGGAGVSSENSPEDRQILEFSPDGKLLRKIGRHADGTDNNQDTSYLGRPAGMDIDDDAHEVYVADGYGNRRVVVYDSDTGAFKRGWGAYGIPLSEIDNGTLPAYDSAAPPSKQFANPVHCVHISNDALVYVCDRVNDRIQVFTKQGHFVKEFLVAPKTLRYGSVWTLNFSHDPKQKYLLVGDGSNQVVWIMNRNDGTVVGSFGHNGRNAGQFHWIHQAAMDSQGALYTGEVDTGKRVQKFVLQK